MSQAAINDDAIARMYAKIETLRAQVAQLQGQAGAMRAALERARQDFNWMMNEQKLLNPFVFEYLDAALASAGPGAPSMLPNRDRETILAALSECAGSTPGEPVQVDRYGELRERMASAGPGVDWSGLDLKVLREACNDAAILMCRQFGADGRVDPHSREWEAKYAAQRDIIDGLLGGEGKK